MIVAAPAPTEFLPPVRGGRRMPVAAARARAALHALLRWTGRAALVTLLALLVVLAWDLWHLVPGRG